MYDHNTSPKRKSFCFSSLVALKFPALIILFIFLATAHFSCTKEGKGLAVSTGKGGSLARFTIVGHHLYMVDRSQLKVFDISAAKPVLKSNTEIGFAIETIFPFRDKLFIGSETEVHIFSIDDPAHPKKLSSAISPTVMRRCDPVVAKDSVAYATLRTNGPCGGIQSILAVYDISNIEKPVEVNREFISEPYGLGYADSALYVCNVNSLLVFNIVKPFEPKRVTEITGEKYIDVIAANNTLICWTARGVVLYDITDRLNPQLITKIS